MASAESLAQLGQRLATTQLLRDELADLCRSYANGAISTTNYTLRLAQLDEKMVTLLTAEMIAGAFQRDSALIGSESRVFGNSERAISPESEKALSDNVTESENELAEADGAVAALLRQGPPKPTPIAADSTQEQIAEIKRQDETASADYQQRLSIAQAKRDSADSAAKRARAAYAEARQSGGAGSPAAASLAIGGRVSPFVFNNATASEQLVRLQQNYLDRDELGAIVDTCLTRMNEDVLGTIDSMSESEKAKALNKLSVATNTLIAKQEQLNSLDAEFYAATSPLTNRLYSDSLESSDLSSAERQRLQGELAKMDSDYRIRTAPLRTEIRQLEAETVAIQATFNQTASSSLFDRDCRTLMTTFSDQLIKAQNARLELKLKELEASVQTVALDARKETSRYNFCSDLIKAKGSGDLESLLLQAGCLRSEAASRPVLGRLETLWPAKESDAPEQSDYEYIAPSYEPYRVPEYHAPTELAVEEPSPE